MFVASHYCSRRLKFPFRVKKSRGHIQLELIGRWAEFLSPLIAPLFARRVLPSGSLALILPLVSHLRTEVGWDRRAHPRRIKRVLLTAPWIFHLSLWNLSQFQLPWPYIYDRKKSTSYKNMLVFCQVDVEHFPQIKKEHKWPLICYSAILIRILFACSFVWQSISQKRM